MIGLESLIVAWDYQIWKVVIDAIPPETVPWWALFFFGEDHFWTWVWKYNPATWWGFTIVVSIAAGIIIAIILYLYFKS